MSTISLTSATLPQGSLGNVFAGLWRKWAAHRSRAAFAGMSERELQDVGWGQADRWSPTLGAGETELDQRARAAAVAAWYRMRPVAA